MRKLLMCLFITTGLLYLSVAAIIATDCVKREKEACIAMSVFWPVTIPIAISGK
jgi:hypothetical protein